MTGRSQQVRGARIIQRIQGDDEVYTLLASWSAWFDAGYPTEGW